MQSIHQKELAILRQATRSNWWRWRSEQKRLRQRGQDTPFAIHLGELQMMHMVWRELRRDAGLPYRRPPHAVWRIARRLADHKCRAFLREHPDP